MGSVGEITTVGVSMAPKASTQTVPEVLQEITHLQGPARPLALGCQSLLH